MAFNDYAHHLRTLGEPILPYSGALWIIRAVLDRQRGRAHVRRPSGCGHGRGTLAAGSGGTTATKSRTGVQRSYASFTLRWGGIVIVLFVIYHLLHLTWNIIHPGGASRQSPTAE